MTFEKNHERVQGEIDRRGAEEFRALTWRFRRAPESLTELERQNLDKLFEKLPALRTLYRYCLRFKEIFDSARSGNGCPLLWTLLDEMAESVLDFSSFRAAYEN